MANPVILKLLEDSNTKLRIPNLHNTTWGFQYKAFVHVPMATKAVFELAVNGFKKSFSVKRACLAVMENRISEKWFQFDQNCTHLTRKWFYTFIPSNHFRVTRKRERGRKKEERVEIVQSRARQYRLPTSPALHRSRSREASITIARSADRVDHDHTKLRSRLRKALIVIVRNTNHVERNLAFALIAIVRSVRIWWFFSGFCLCFEEWMIFYICLATEKMWATSRKCVFYGIFKNTTKHQKIFFETFFEMQPNTWKHFPLRKIAFLENKIFSRNTFTWTKRSLI